LQTLWFKQKLKKQRPVLEMNTYQQSWQKCLQRVHPSIDYRSTGQIHIYIYWRIAKTAVAMLTPENWKLN